MPTKELLALGMFGGGSRLVERIELLLERGRVFSPGMSGGQVAVSALALIACLVAGAVAPSVIAFAQDRLTFEVATIKPSAPEAFDREGTMIGTPPGRLEAKNITLRGAIKIAYNLISPQLLDVPSWADSEHFNIEAKTAGAVPRDQVMRMLQSLLADRFNLKAHRETRTLPVYALTVAKNGPKMPRRAADDPSSGSSSFGSRNVNAKGVTIDFLARTLADLLTQPVLDRTGLTDLFDIKLDFARLQGNPDEETLPSLFTAIQEQLGLKLETTKAPVEVMVINGAERPDAN